MRKRAFFGAFVAVFAVFVGTAASAFAGVTGPAFYVDGALYRTVGTPTDFSGTGAPADTYDIIYAPVDMQGDSVQPNVAEAAPGDPDFNGGRWMVHKITFSDYAGAIADASVDMNDNDVLDSDQEVLAAISEGYATDDGVVKQFECPVIKVPKGGH